MAEKNPQNITIRGRLSFPNFTMAEALVRNGKSNFPKKEAEVRPDFQVLLDEAQVDKLVAHVKDVFLPWCEEQGKAKAKSGLTPAQVKKLVKILDEGEWEVDALLGLIKPVHEKTAELAPEAAATVPVKGFIGQDIELKAVVRDESELKNPATDLIIPDRGLILPANDTTHELYPGSVVATTINLYAFTGANVGITASTSTVVFIRDDERFGGGGSSLNEEEIFLDMDHE